VYLCASIEWVCLKRNNPLCLASKADNPWERYNLLLYRNDWSQSTTKSDIIKLRPNPQDKERLQTLLIKGLPRLGLPSEHELDHPKLPPNKNKQVLTKIETNEHNVIQSVRFTLYSACCASCRKICCLLNSFINYYLHFCSTKGPLIFISQSNMFPKRIGLVSGNDILYFICGYIWSNVTPNYNIALMGNSDFRCGISLYELSPERNSS
jgi:hypothetical protein